MHRHQPGRHDRSWLLADIPPRTDRCPLGTQRRTLSRKAQTGHHLRQSGPWGTGDLRMRQHMRKRRREIEEVEPEGKAVRPLLPLAARLLPSDGWRPPMSLQELPLPYGRIRPAMTELLDVEAELRVAITEWNDAYGEVARPTAYRYRADGPLPAAFAEGSGMHRAAGIVEATWMAQTRALSHTPSTMPLSLWRHCRLSIGRSHFERQELRQHHRGCRYGRRCHGAALSR